MSSAREQVQAGTDARRSAMSASQLAIWLADRAFAGGAAYNLGWLIDLDGPLDADALGLALGAVTARHEALRMTVLEFDGHFMIRTDPPRPAAEFKLAVVDVPEAEADTLAKAVVIRPFDPAAAPLWRAELHRLGPRRHRLVFVAHHVIADTATVALVFADIAAAYRPGERQPACLPAARAFTEYIALERDFACRQEGAAAIAYLAGQVSDVPPLALPADRPRDQESARPGAILRFSIAAADADPLRALARRQGATLQHVLLACYATMLHRFAGRDELLVGVPVSLRRGGWADCAGLFVNTVPIRVSLRDNPRLCDLVSQVRGTVFAAIGAASAPLTEVVAAARRLPGHAGPLYQATFGLTPRARIGLDLPGIRTQIRGVYPDQAKFDLHLEVAEHGAGAPLTVTIEYDTDLFEAATAQRLADGFTAIARAACRSPEQVVGAMPLWESAVAPRPAASDTVKPLPGGGRVDRLFAETVAARSGQVALVDCADGSELRYGELSARAAAVTQALAARGIGRGDFVGITLPRGTDLVVAILGVLAAGAAYVPLDPAYPVRQLAGMIENAGIRLIIGAVPAGLGVTVIDLPACSSTAQPGADRIEVGPGTGEDPAYVMFTSGSTGKPKAVVVPHRAIVRLVRGTDFAAMTPAERWLHCASPSFDAATLELWAPLLNGGTMVVLPGLLTVAALSEALKRYLVTSAFLTTGLFNLVVDTDPGALAPLRELITGGEAASVAHLAAALEVVPAVTNGYGPTENTTFTTCYRLPGQAQLSGPVPIGSPIAGTTVHIVDENIAEVAPGMIGEIVTGGLGLAIGYAGAPALTAERFVPNPFGPPGSRLYRTGDYGKIGADGTVRYAGRQDDQVKVRGYRIQLGAIEHALATHPGVGQAAVVVHTDPTGDKRLVGYTVGPAGPDELTGHLRGLLPGYMIPGQWIALDALPLGPTGKVDRNALSSPAPAPEADRQEAAEAQDLIMSCYAELLGHREVTPDTDFFLAGGHSLFAARIVSRVKASFGIDLKLSVIFDHPRIADLALVITRSMAGQAADTERSS
jgi:amino acid adenylation domain-containing protein